MGWTIIVLLSVVQGATEFLPVSSSGHLWIVRFLFGHKPDLLFDLVVHVGTLAAVVVFFRTEIGMLFRSGAGRRTLALICLGSVPTAALGLGLKSFVENAVHGPVFIGLMLLITGLFLFIAGRTGGSTAVSDGESDWQINWKQALAIGVMQGFAVIPGISRSGITLSTGLLLGLGRNEAYRFAFLLSIPAVAGAFLLKAAELDTPAALVSPAMGAALVISAVVGLGALAVLKKIVMKSKLTAFTIYVWIIGFVLIGGALGGMWR